MGRLSNYCQQIISGFSQIGVWLIYIIFTPCLCDWMSAWFTCIFSHFLIDYSYNILVQQQQEGEGVLKFMQPELRHIEEIIYICKYDMLVKNNELCATRLSCHF